MDTKKDYIVAIVAGFLTALFLWPTLKNINLGAGYLPLLVLIVVPVLWVLGLAIGKFLGRWLPVIYQFAKFVVVGFLNTSIDFGVLNLLSMFTGVTAGFLIGGVNVPGFILASANSYFWNKFWVFSASAKASADKGRDYSDFFSFAAVVLVGIFINGGIVVLLTTCMSPLWGLTPERWLNMAKVAATVISLVWNFVGMKFFVFRPEAE